MLKSSWPIIFLYLLVPPAAYPAEGDAFTARNYVVSEGIGPVDIEVRNRIKRAVDTSNAMSSCKKSILEINLGVELLRPFYGKIEHFANVAPQVPKTHIPFDQSVYVGIPDYYYRLLQIGEILFGFGNMIRSGDWIIGPDKFGHFFDEGHDLYLRLDDQASNLQDILEINERSEEGINGLAVGGVKSYGDMVANFNGMVFWSEILDQKYLKRNPYVICEENKWVIIRNFSFHDYIDAGWDEAYNCNDYATQTFQNAMNLSISQIGSKSGLFFQCPISTIFCSQLRDKYHEYMPSLINPKSCQGF